jgi:predicted MPP superfamily phosphohydrolase
MRFFASVALGAQVALASHYFDGLNRVHLRMNNDNRFKILQLTDLHLGEVGMGHLDAETLHMIRSLCEKERPDFVAITGDLISGQAWDRQEPHFWERHYVMIAETLTNLQVPWGMVPGFHDFEADATQAKMMELEG